MTWFPKKKVVVPIDFSDQSIGALDTALQLVESPQSITAVHVLPDMSPADPGEMWRTVDHDARARHAGQALRERLSDPKYAHVLTDVLFGDAGHEIAGLAERQHADLIVLPSHGRTGIKRLLIGSVAERVVRLAHCPVLVLRG